ncbi:MAG: DUF885 family protein [Phenylobacterium sp.]|uniref:DUF885 domain-containing protein n=1 Tax=Phenylobacterium sp. TaxID=1871053 RepID=UPI002735C57F|nr:DUF885 family protein [Phenylobacterium sp.]MDP3748730.1 DUF885 family protein [Phenylobacterium sp.]
MLNRRHVLAGAIASLAASNTARAETNPAAARARALYDEIFESILRTSPTTASGLGFDTGPRSGLKSKLDDRSPSARMNVFQPMIDARPKLAAIDRKALTGLDASRYDTVAWLADRDAEAAAFPYGGVDSYDYPVPYVVSQLTGAYQKIPDFLDSKHFIESKADAEAYLSRLTVFAQNVRDENGRLRADAAMGVVPPDFVLDKALTQLRSLAAQKGEGSGLAASLGRRAAEKGLGADWAAKAATIVDGPLASALADQIALLTEHRRIAVHEVGVSRLPDGRRYYDLGLRYHTTTNLTPPEAHKVGLAQVAELSARADVLLRAQGLTQGSVGARLTAFGKDPSQLYPNTEAGRATLLADLNRTMEAVRARTPQVFATLPKAGMEIRRVPPAIELGAPRGYAEGGTLDGSRPGTFYINLRDTADWPKWSLNSLTYHESVPGHLFQGAVLLEAPGAPLLLKTMGFTAYGEGWGLYAEQLGDELGMYDAYPAGRIGYLQSFLYRAARIVLDTGMHSQGWSREKAVTYMIETVGLPVGAAENEIDRYVVWPGQACGYKIGHTEFDRLRTKAHTALGAKFDLKAFHDLVLLGGAMPLAVLERVVDDWTRQRLGA